LRGKVKFVPRREQAVFNSHTATFVLYRRTALFILGALIMHKGQRTGVSIFVVHGANIEHINTVMYKYSNT
jgi:hypothetical protein